MEYRLSSKAKTSHSLRGKPKKIILIEIPIDEYQDHDPWTIFHSKTKTQVLLKINIFLLSSSQLLFHFDLVSIETLSPSRSHLCGGTKSLLWWQWYLLIVVILNPYYCDRKTLLWRQWYLLTVVTLKQILHRYLVAL